MMHTTHNNTGTAVVYDRSNRRQRRQHPAVPRRGIIAVLQYPSKSSNTSPIPLSFPRNRYWMQQDIHTASLWWEQW